jgi:hypothetical protein
MSAPAISTPTLGERFALRFRGLDRAYGRYIPAKAKKPGKLKLEAVRDPATVREPVTLAHYERHMRGEQEQGIGIIPVTDDATCWFAAIDVDQYDGLDHAALEEKIDRLGLPLIVCESKSGGAHIYVFFSEPVPAKVAREKLKAFAKALKLPKGTEIFPKQDRLESDKDCGNWINLPYFGESRFAIINGGPQSLEMFLKLADAVAITEAELHELNLTAPKPSSHGLVPGDITDGQRNIKFFKAACRMRGAGAEEDEIRDTLLEVNTQIADPEEEKKIIDIARRVVRKYEPGTRHSAPDAEDVIAELNATYAIVQAGDKVRILQEWGPSEFTLLPREEFRALLSNRFCEVGGKSQCIADVWVRSPQRRQFSRIVFEPGGTRTPGAYNVFSGWTVQPRPGDCSQFKEHLLENICKGNEDHYRWVWAWFAHQFQHPADKPGTALVFRGEPGTGKTIVGKIVGRLLGPHYTFASRAEDITGRFNAPMERCMLLQAEEAFWAGDKNAEGVLKDRITNDRQYIERKGVDRIEVDNHMRLLITSNADWVVPAGPMERRFAVFDVGNGKIQDQEYFGRMWEQMKPGRGELEALLHEFLTTDLTVVNVRQIPSTAALQEQKIASGTAEEKWWLDILMEGTLPGDDKGLGISSTNCLHQDYVTKAKILGYNHRSSVTQFGIMLKKMVPVVPGRAALRQRRMDSRGHQFYTYEFPSLKACRQEFDRRMRYTRGWDLEEAWGQCPTDRQGEQGGRF